MQLTQINRTTLGKLDYRYGSAGNITAISTQPYAYDGFCQANCVTE